MNTANSTGDLTADRKLLEAFLERLHRDAALSCPPGNLKAAIDDTLNHVDARPNP